MRKSFWALLIVVGQIVPAIAQDTTHRPSVTFVGLTRASELLLDDPTGDDWLTAQKWNATLYGGASIGNDAGETYEAHLGLGHNLFDDLSINLELIGGFADMANQGIVAGGDGVLTGVDLLFRWHFLKAENLTIYFDGGAGLMYSDHSLPAHGTHFNFRPQAGFGLSIDLDGSTHLICGARWLHISNAGTGSSQENPGYDAAFIYTGVLIPF